MKKILPLMALVSSVACGDTNNYNVAGGDGENASPLTNCQEFMEKDYFCNPQRYQDYINHWGGSIEDKKQRVINECTKGNWQSIPGLMACMGKSCEYINSGACDAILDQAGL